MVRKKIKKESSGGETPTDEEIAKFVEALEKLDSEKLEGIRKEFGGEVVHRLLCARAHILTNKFLSLLLDEVESIERRIEHIECKLGLG